MNNQPPQPPTDNSGNPPLSDTNSTVPQNPNAGQLRTDGYVFAIPPHPKTTFNDEEFLALLEGSISLTLEEKQKVIDAIPQLEQSQIDDLFTIFVEEKRKFAELELEFADDVTNLKKEREKEIEISKNQQQEKVSTQEDANEAERIKKEMGL